jgi:hypothetical protein
MLPLLVARTWESEGTLLAYLDACEDRALVVGNETEAPRAFYSFSVNSDCGRIEVGVITSGLGAGAAATLLDRGQRLLVGHDTRMTWIDTKTLTVISSRPLGGVFYEFLPLDCEDEIVLIHELGLLRVNANGVVKWSVDTGVVESATTDTNDNVILTIMDAPGCMVSLESGKVSPTTKTRR